MCPRGTRRKRLIAGQPGRRAAGSAQVEAETSRQARSLSRGWRGVRDPMDPAGDRRSGVRDTSLRRESGGWLDRFERGVRDAEGAGVRRSGVRQREEAPGGAPENSGRGWLRRLSARNCLLLPMGPIAFPLAGTPCRGNVPASRRGFSFVSAHLRTSLGTLSSVSSLSVAHSLFPSRSSQSRVTFLPTARYSSLSSSRCMLGFHLCPSRESPFDTSRPCVFLFCSFSFHISPCPSLGEGPSRLPALIRLLNATRVDTLPCPKGDHSFRIPTRVTIVIEKRKTRRWMKRNCRKNRLTKKYIPNVLARRKAHDIMCAYKPSVIQISRLTIASV